MSGEDLWGYLLSEKLSVLGTRVDAYSQQVAMSTYQVPDSVLRAEATVVGKADRVHVPLESHVHRFWGSGWGLILPTSRGAGLCLWAATIEVWKWG